MAGKSAAPAPTGANALATTSKAGLPSLNNDALTFLESKAGQGMEQVKMADVLMPRVSILQSLSPQLKRSKPEFIEGAQEGQIYNAQTNQLSDSIRVIPCAYIRHHLEWKPNRGGLVADHGEAGEALLAHCRRDDKNFDILPNGNILIPTATWYCIDAANGRQCVIPMSRTQLRPSRRWMSMATSEVINPRDFDPNDTRPPFNPPLFFRAYDLTTVTRQDEQNEWFVWSVSAGPDIFSLDDDGSLVAKAVQFRDLVMSGEVRADAAAFQDDAEQEAGNSGRSGSNRQDDDSPM